MGESLTSNEHAESLRTAAKRLYGVCDYQNSSTCEEAADEIDRLHAKLDRAEQIMAAAYQLAGLVGAPVRFLDALSRQEGDIENLCPVTLDECDEFKRLSEPPNAPTSKTLVEQKATTERLEKRVKDARELLVAWFNYDSEDVQFQRPPTDATKRFLGIAAVTKEGALPNCTKCGASTWHDPHGGIRCTNNPSCGTVETNDGQ